jgi:group I intron endonuclease
MIVYKVTSPSGKCYVGITTQDFQQRKLDHYTSARNKKRAGKFQKAIIKYSNELIWEIIDTSANSLEKLCELEKYYIQKFNSYENGYNCTLGGEGNWGWKPSEEVRKKMSKWQKGKKLTDKHKLKLSAAKLGKKRGPRSEEHSENIAKARGVKPFHVYKKDTLVFIGTWNTYSKCARDLNISMQHIGKCLKKKKGFLSIKGYIFRYEGGVPS